MIVMQLDSPLTLTATESRILLACLAGGGGLVLKLMWAKARDFRDVAERTRAIDQTLHGDPKAHESNGLVRKLNHVATKLDALSANFSTHVTEEAQQVVEGNRLRTEANNRLHVRLTSIEDRLPKRRGKA